MTMILLALSLAAYAEPVGLVIRLNAGTEALTAPVVVTFTPPTGEAVSVELTDDGQKPDVAAGDSNWAGSGLLSDASVSVSVSGGGGQSFPVGAVTWEAGEGAKDLDLTLAGGKITASATRQSGAGGAGGTGGAGGGAPVGDGGGAPTGAPTAGAPEGAGASPAGGFTVASGGAARPRSATFPGESGGAGDSTLFIVFGAGLLVLVGIAWAWARGRRGGGGAVGDAARAPSGLTLVPEPGLLGEGSPSLADGLFSWVAWPGQLEAQVGAALQTLAWSHRVLVVARSSLSLPGVHGGPVYRVNAARPTHVGAVAEALVLEGGPPLAVLLVGVAEDEASLRDYADLLPMGVGGVVLSEKALGPFPQVVVRAMGESYAVKVGEVERRFVLGEGGLTEVRGS
jgi:hypothetical protein